MQITNQSSPWRFPQRFAALQQIELPQTTAVRWGLSAPRLTLRRTWPQDVDHVAVEFVTPAGEIVPGQWIADDERRSQILRSTRKAAVDPDSVIKLDEHKLILQAHGADRRLRGLGSLLAQPGAQIIVHRPERRAVVRLQQEGETVFAKAVRPEKSGALAAALTWAAEHIRTFATPALLHHDEVAGIVSTAALAGKSVHDLYDSPAIEDALKVMGRTLGALHEMPAPAWAVPHAATQEVGVLARWMDRLHDFAPRLHAEITIPVARVAEMLTGATGVPTLLHRDFYDKQIFVTDDGEAGLLDLDTLAVGEAELDVANALVHLELRSLQTGRLGCSLQRARAAFLREYPVEWLSSERLQVYADATRLRLACVYAFRPGGVSMSPQLLARLGQPATDLVLA
ncbi:phosphotransferase [bacterium]|nr:phosphotransferase [bacterium]